MTMINRILTLPEKDGLPEVLGAAFVTAQSDCIFVAYGPQVPGVNTAFKHDLHTFLFRAKPGLYAVFAEEETFHTIDPSDEGQCMVDWKATPAVSEWPTDKLWREADLITPTIPGSIGEKNLVAILTEKSVAQAPP